MAGPVEMRLIFLGFLVACLTLLPAWPGAEAIAQETDDAAAAAEEPAEAVPVEGTAEYADLVLDRYADVRGWGAVFVRDGKGDPEALRLLMPKPPDVDSGRGTGPELGLPLEPASYRKRFKRLPFKQDAETVVSFRSIEVGWIAGGLTEAASDGFAAPHLEVHFKTTAALPEQPESACPADQESCEPPTEGASRSEMQTRRPGRCFLPRNATAVTEAATPDTGLYNLASGPEADPSAAGSPPVAVYGTYDGEIVSLGVLLTPDMLKHAVTEGEFRERLSWPISQPAAFRYAWWPRTVALEYRPDSRVFAVSLEDFSRREIRETCD
jgi:hypothetical protein